MAEARTFRFEVPPCHGQGQATVLLTEDGIFSILSDFGSYCVRLPKGGVKDVRLRLVLLSKEEERRLKEQAVPWARLQYDGARTAAVIKKRLLWLWRSEVVTLAQARYEWRVLRACRFVQQAGDFHQWLETSSLQGGGELEQRGDPLASLFFRETLPRLQVLLTEALRCELRSYVGLPGDNLLRRKGMNDINTEIQEVATLAFLLSTRIGALSERMEPEVRAGLFQPAAFCRGQYARMKALLARRGGAMERPAAAAETGPWADELESAADKMETLGALMRNLALRLLAEGDEDGAAHSEQGARELLTFAVDVRALKVFTPQDKQGESPR